jgi:hypothetical protein
VLERSTPRDSAEPADPLDLEPSAPSAEPGDDQAAEARGRGVTAPKKGRAADAKPGKKPKARTIYLDDGLFERILVQSHRRDRTISEYVAGILDRQVPDHRVVSPRNDQAADPG